VINEFAINGDAADVKNLVAAYQGNKKPREVFKRFYKDEDFQKLVSSGAKPYNPWKHWVESNPAANNEFLEKFKTAMHGVMKNGYTVDVSKLTVLAVKLRKV
jgi:hypothetical protein